MEKGRESPKTLKQGRGRRSSHRIRQIGQGNPAEGKEIRRKPLHQQNRKGGDQTEVVAAGTEMSGASKGLFRRRESTIVVTDGMRSEEQVQATACCVCGAGEQCDTCSLRHNPSRNKLSKEGDACRVDMLRGSRRQIAVGRGGGEG